MSDATYVANLKKLSAREPSPDDIDAIDQEAYRADNDRALVLLLGSQLEANLLAYINKSKFREDMNSDQRKRVFGFQGIVGTFAAKIAASYALSLVGPIIYKDLDLIREIRNAFAHARIPLNFKMPELIDICSHLKTPELPKSYVPNRYLAQLSAEEAEIAKLMTYSKTRFVTTCHQISFRMFCVRNPKIFRDKFDDNEIILP